ncbi:hypothetical protein ABZ348_06090 [Streptomyces sp. NPDC005963]|uniref:hypothetical protein n=1 Tax=Streptomyces sp. NPDC005963 TaxID=3156721 RepID=UPI0033FDF015
MPAYPRESEPAQQPTAEPLPSSRAVPGRPASIRPSSTAPSMYDLLASCTAARAISTPPREADPAVPAIVNRRERRDAA